MKIKADELAFTFCEGTGRRECDLCGKRYDDHGVEIELSAGEYGMGGFWAGRICGNCLMPDPKALARAARDRAPILRRKRVPRGDDEDLYTNWADDMLALADALDGIPDYSAITSGIVACKIAEAYRELDGQRSKGKAA